MNLGEKIYKLRKEKGLSQEALAEQLGTTRQAVSKWENNQGYPETEKLLQLSNIFAVSIDYLLREDKSEKNNDEKGYYVSREMAKGYIVNEKKVCKYAGLGVSFFALAGIPYVMFTSETAWRFLGMAVCIVLGIVALVIGAFAEQDRYKVLKQEPLLFDYEYLKELSHEFGSVKKRYKTIAIPCTILFITGTMAIVLTVREILPWSEYHSFIFLGFAIGLFGFIYSAGTFEAYELLVKNEQYSSRLLFKIKKKVKEKIDRM